ncbi:uncharacterized protein LOC120333789 [Styela clava]
MPRCKGFFTILLFSLLTFGETRTIILPYNCEYFDIVFVVDGSGSVTKENFEIIREWLISTTSSIHDKLGEKAEIGILEYSGYRVQDGKKKNAFEIPFGLGDCTTKECMTEKISSMRYLKGSTLTYAALNRTLEVEFPRSPRANVSQKSLVLITDGRANDGQYLLDWYYESVKRNVTSFVVGVGSYNLTELKIVANGGVSMKNVFTEDTYKSLPRILLSLVDKFCEDVDECFEGNMCFEHSTCRNTKGSFECDCHDGYGKNKNGTCVDINECLQKDICNHKHTCLNHPGGYSCGCRDGYFDEGVKCSECTCTEIEGYNKTFSCLYRRYNCSYTDLETGVTRSCSVPSGSAFDALFEIIENWQKRASAMTSEKEVINEVIMINDAIQCAAIATVNSSPLSAKKFEVEISSMDIESADQNELQAPLKTFSSSKLHNASVTGMDVGRMIGIQFEAPKECVDIILKQPENLYSGSTLSEYYIFTGRNPTISVSVFNKENFTYRKDARVTFDVDVLQDFTNSSFLPKDVPDPSLGRGYVSDVGYQCMFIDTMSEKMSAEGCEATTYDTGSKVTCDCNHTTMFAVLLTMTEVNVPRGVKILTYIVEIPTVIFLIITVTILSSVRSQIRGDRIVVQICLSASLLGLHVFNLFHDLALKQEVTCEILTVVIHYLLLTSGMWMLMEGLTLVAKTHDYVLQYLSEGRQRRFAIARHVVSWGLPLLIVFITALVGFLTDSYMHKSPLFVEKLAREERWDLQDVKKYNYCWLSSTLVLWSVVLPMAIIIILNCAILVRMGLFVFKMSAQGDNYKPNIYKVAADYSDFDHAKATFKAILVLLPVLGVSWTLAFLTSVNMRNSSVYFMYINVILNGLQGVFLFIVYCVIGKEVRKALAIKYKRMAETRKSRSINDSYAKRSSNINSKQAPRASPNITNKTWADKTNSSRPKSSGLALPSENLTKYSPNLSTRF